MKHHIYILAAALSVLMLGACAPTRTAAQAPAEVTETAAPADCAVTTPQSPAFSPPAPFDWLVAYGFWYGSDALWTDLPPGGVWSDLPHGPDGYPQKLFWWSTDFDAAAEPIPALTVSGRRLDGSSETISTPAATNASGADIETAMLTGVDFPEGGCWEITGRYKGASLTYVVQVSP